jgi:c-di-GMP-binding flagellar brake protein YcgR
MNTERVAYEEENNSEQFRITSPAEVVAILRALMADNVLLTVSFDGPDNLFVTHLVAVNPRDGEIVCDGIPNACNGNTNYAPILSVHALHKDIKVIFASRDGELTTFANRPAYKMQLPDSVIRLQRRLDYRAKVPVLTAPTISVRKEGSAEPLNLRISDISCGGLSFTVLKERVTFPTGKVLLGCKLEIPRIGAIEVSIEVRHIFQYRDGTGRAMQRYGCNFFRINGTSAKLIQRYINQIEIDRRKSVGRM